MVLLKLLMFSASDTVESVAVTLKTFVVELSVGDAFSFEAERFFLKNLNRKFFSEHPQLHKVAVFI